MNRLTIIVVVLLARSFAGAEQSPLPTTQPTASAVVTLWPEGKMPGKGAAATEQEVAGKSDGFHRITNISKPTLTLYPAKKSDTPRPAVIVCPGGGYSYLVVDKEGSEIAGWLNDNGISALVLKYRVPNNREGALQDVQRAISITRSRAAEWNIDPNHIGVIGFSAGGNLACKASNLFDQRAYEPIEEADRQSCRPDFAILVYPAYLDKDGKVASDLNLRAKIPPTLIVHTEDDKRFVVGSKLYHAALDEAKIDNKLLLYPSGGHGYALHCTKDAKVWPKEAIEWLAKIGVK
jgi:acetyl esterase/lipase